MDFSHARILVMGLGRFGGGVGVTRFLARRGARVLVTDLAPPEQLGASVAKLADLGGAVPAVEFRLGEHRESDFAAADLVVVNPAVDPRNNRFIQAAVAAGVPLTSEIRLLTQHLPNRLRTIGITGSAGKSTTTGMIGHVLAKALRYEGAQARSEGHAAGAGNSKLETRNSKPQVWVGGNLGGSLLDCLDAIDPDDWIVLELSSFMLEGLDLDRWSPHLAVVTNLTNNHLDRHGTLEAYAAAKQTILRHQQPGDVALLGAGVADWPVAPGVTRLVIEDRDYGLPLLLPGQHNQVNAMTAIALAEAIAAGPRAALAAALADFPGLDHRLQFVAERGGVRYYNDSKATTPEAAALALRSFAPGIVHVILGGYDKHSDLTAVAQLAARHCRGVYTIGVTGAAIATAAFAAGDGAESRVQRCGTLARALEAIAARVQPGDVVLLSPACASWDQFENFEQRGAAFVELVTRAAT